MSGRTFTRQPGDERRKPTMTNHGACAWCGRTIHVQPVTWGWGRRHRPATCSTSCAEAMANAGPEQGRQATITGRP